MCRFYSDKRCAKDQNKNIIQINQELKIRFSDSGCQQNLIGRYGELHDL